MIRERVVASCGPFNLLHRTVGSRRYWYVIHAPSGKQAATFDAAPCSGKVKDVVAKFKQLTANWPDMSDMDPRNIELEDITRLLTLRSMFERVSATEFKVVP